MDRPPLADITLKLLHICMRPDFRESVLKRALTYRKSNSSPACRRLGKALRGLEIDGYKHADRAPVHFLLPEALGAVCHSPERWGTVLPVWIESQDELRATAEAFLAGKGIEVEARDLFDGFTTTWTVAEMEELGEEFLALRQEFDRDDALLMICCLTGRAPLTEEMEAELSEKLPAGGEQDASEEPVAEGGMPPAWQPWIDELRELPADAPEWQHVETLLQAIQSIAEEKRKERESGRESLRAAIDALLEETAEELEFFEFADVRSWTAESCSLDKAVQLATRVDELRMGLVEYRDLNKTPVATLAEQRQRQRAASKIEKRLVEIHDSLAAELAGPTGPDEPPAGPDTEKPEEEGLVEPAGGQETPREPEPPLPTPGDEPASEEGVTPGSGGGDTTAEEISAEPETPREEAKPAAKPVVPAEAAADEEEATSAAPPPVLELCSSAEAAAALQVQDSPDNWLLYLAALVAESDLAGAYWLAHSLAASGKPNGVADWLLAAAQGAGWPSLQSGALIPELLDIASNHTPSRDDAEAMLGLAAALRPVLIAPGSGLLGWLRAPDCCPGTRNLVAAVNEFAKLGMALHPEDLRGVAGAQQLEDAIAEAVEEAARWLSEAPVRRPSYKRAADVWHHLLRPGGEISAMLSPVAEDDRTQMQQVRGLAREWQERDHVLGRINGIDLERVGKKARHIDGPAREHIVRGVEDACARASQWCDLVERERARATRGDWLSQRVAQLRADVEACLPEVESSVALVADEPTRPLEAAAARCLQWALQQLRELLGLAAPPEGREAGSALWRWLVLDTNTLQEGLARRLLWLPEITVGDDARPVEESVPEIAWALSRASAEERTVRQAFDLWLQGQDYRFVQGLLEALGTDDDVVDLQRRYQEALAGSRAALQEKKDKTVNQVEQAVLDGVIAEEERSEHLSLVQTMREDEVRSFAPRYKALERVRDRLGKARGQRLAEVKARWEKLEPRLAASSIEEEKQGHIRDILAAALERGDARVADEHLAQLEEVLDTGRELDTSLLTATVTRDYLQEFGDSIEDIEEWLEGVHSLQSVADNIRRGHGKGHLSLVLPKPRLREAGEAIDAWRRLKHGGLPQRESLQCIQTLLRYLGFSFPSGTPTPLALEQEAVGWLHARAAMSASSLSKPIPQFGSLAHGHYDVVCVWERPSADTIAARLREQRLSAHPVLVFYLGRLTPRQRSDFMRINRAGQLGLAILDETLLVFLAQEREARLPAFLSCALPYGALNPYTPFQAGDVPPEMFYGRADMAHELQLAAGSCLVYGGRQLGKSALLRHVQRLFHDPARERYAWIENMKLTFETHGGKGPENIWRTLRDDFKREGVLSAQVKADGPRQIRRLLQDALRESPERRVLVMFDEADDFLDADSRADFSTVMALRDLMSETQRRFKVVFAGLHNVQRFQGIPNQPLAHFGAPICVGPLEPEAAEKLVREPLEALGYRFPANDGNATMLRILSYTNYHPGLIQLFCHELLQALRKRAGAELPPYTIEQADVESVYRRPEVRQRIRERLDWTLALDPRYQAVAWTMIVDQMKAHDSYAEPYTAGTILQAVREWWPKGFKDVSIEELKGGVLEEMVGLGVLVRNANGHYRLRSPNLVRLMGTEDDISDRLLELGDHEPPKPSDSESHHAMLDEEARCYSPLTYAEERSLSPQRSGVSLVFASEAQGAPQAREAFKRFAPEGPDGAIVWYDTPPWIIDGEALCTWMGSQLHASGRLKRLVFCYQPTSHRPQELERLVRQTLHFCAAHSPKDVLVRVLLLFEAQCTWAWLSLHDEVRQELEDRADAALWPQHWNQVGIRQRLGQQDKLGSDEACKRILQATGGWPILLDTVLERCGAHSDPSSYADGVGRELSAPESELAERFRHALGIEGHDVVDRILRFVMREEVTADLVVPGFVGGEPPLSDDECKRGLEFLRRMGCVVQHGGVLAADPTVASMLRKP